LTHLIKGIKKVNPFTVYLPFAIYRLHFGWELGFVVSFMDLLAIDLLVILLRM